MSSEELMVSFVDGVCEEDEEMIWLTDGTRTMGMRLGGSDWLAL